MIKKSNNLKAAHLLLGDKNFNLDCTSDKVKTKPYTCIDDDIPVARFRGTSIKLENSIIKIKGWQRNVSRLQKMDVSFPTIINLELDLNGVIKSINLDSGFKGSRGLLCHQNYLDNNLSKRLINKKLNNKILKKIQVNELHCFHLSEVLLGAISLYDFYKEMKSDEILEEEVTDSYISGEDFIASGKQFISEIDEEIKYQIVYKNALNIFEYNENGTIYSNEDFKVEFHLNGEKQFEEIYRGKTNRRFFYSISLLSNKIINSIKSKYFASLESEYLFTNLHYQSLFGLLSQGFVMKKYSNDFAYIVNCLSALQRSENKPYCIGAVNSKKEADKYFEESDVPKIFFNT